MRDSGRTGAENVELAFNQVVVCGPADTVDNFVLHVKDHENGVENDFKCDGVVLLVRGS